MTFLCVTVRQISALLDSVISTPLSELTVNVLQEYPEDDEAAVVATSGALATIQRFQNLTSIQLVLWDATVEWEGFVPLLPCPRLEVVSLDGWNAATAVTDEGILLMAKAWPSLRALIITDEGLQVHEDEPIIPTATLKGLASLSLYNPFLESLCISVDARGMDAASPSAVVGTNVKYLALCYTVADYEGREHIASFIASMWPNQQRTDESFLWDENGVQRGWWEEIWTMIEMRLVPSIDE